MHWGLTGLWWKIRRQARDGASAGIEAAAAADTGTTTTAPAAERKAEPEREPEGAVARAYSPLQLAYLGDAVYELLVRRDLLMGSTGGDTPASLAELHRQAVSRVRAGAQAAALARVLPRLNPIERDVVRRARNARPRHNVPAGASSRDYRYSSGLEALFGFLFLEGQLARMEEIFRWTQEGNEKK